MKSTAVICFAMLVLAVSLSAQEAANEGESPELFSLDAHTLFGGISASQEIGSVPAGEVGDILARISIARQEAEYVRYSRRASWLLPGTGQFINDDASSGTLFLLGHIAVTAGSIIGAYALLPDDLKFSRIDYISDSLGSIEDAWKSHSLGDYIPSMAALFGGMIVKSALRWFSADHAGRLAEERIQSGEITFEADISELFWPEDDRESFYGKRH